MKKKFLLGIPCAAIAIASVIGVSQFDSENLAGNDLLMENVEAAMIRSISHPDIFASASAFSAASTAMEVVVSSTAI